MAEQKSGNGILVVPVFVGLGLFVWYKPLSVLGVWEKIGLTFVALVVAGEYGESVITEKQSRGHAFVAFLFSTAAFAGLSIVFLKVSSTGYYHLLTWGGVLAWMVAVGHFMQAGEKALAARAVATAPGIGAVPRLRSSLAASTSAVASRPHAPAHPPRLTTHAPTGIASHAGARRTCHACGRSYTWSEGNPRAPTAAELMICVKKHLPIAKMRKVSCPHCGAVTLSSDPYAPGIASHGSQESLSHRAPRPRTRRLPGGGSKHCSQCGAALRWWSMKTLADLGLHITSTGLVGPRPTDFAGVCTKCRDGYCDAHANGTRCPTCGNPLTGA